MQLTVRDVARLLGVSDDAVVRWARQGGLAAQQRDDLYRFNLVQLRECAQALDRPVQPAALGLDPDGPAAASLDLATLPPVATALEHGGIHHQVGGAVRDEVLAAIVALPSIPPQADRQLLLRLLIKREQLASSGVGEGIAVPHARDPLVVPVATPVLILAFLAQPVDFLAVDGLPVTMVFTLLAPTGRIHLQALGALMHTLQDGELRRLLDTQAAAAAIRSRVRTLDAARRHLL